MAVRLNALIGRLIRRGCDGENKMPTVNPTTAVAAGTAFFLLIGIPGAHAIRECSFGLYRDGEECITKGGGAICKFNLYAPSADQSGRWTCRTPQGERLYIRKRNGKWYLTRSRRR